METINRRRIYGGIEIVTSEVVVPDMRVALAMTKGSDETGVLVWPSTHFICEHLSEDIASLAGKTVIELGAGAGIPGLLAASKAARCVITDGNPGTVDYIAKNVTLNPHISQFGGVECQVLRWGPDVPESIGKHAFDLILGSDLMYKAEAFDPFFQACSALLKQSQDSKIVVAYVFENQIDKVESAALRAGLKPTLTNRIAIDISRIEEWQVLDYGEEVILQEYRVLTQE